MVNFNVINFYYNYKAQIKIYCSDHIPIIICMCVNYSQFTYHRLKKTRRRKKINRSMRYNELRINMNLKMNLGIMLISILT